MSTNSEAALNNSQTGRVVIEQFLVRHVRSMQGARDLTSLPLSQTASCFQLKVSADICFDVLGVS